MQGFFQKLLLPDLWQQEAVRALKAGEDVIVDAPTGSGKTRIFELFIEGGGIKARGQAVFTVPTRALANDKWSEWQDRGWKVGIATGDVAENLDAPIIVATLETQRERFLRGLGPALLVVDEYQMISDHARGLHYELALALAPRQTQLLLLSGSVANPDRMADWLRSKGRAVSVIREKHRPVPLDEVHVESLPLAAPKELRGFFPRLAVEVLLADLAPLLIFVPRRQGAEDIARRIAENLPNLDPLSLTVAQEQVCGKDLAKLLRARVAYHHSGLSYETRAGLVEPLARAGQLRVVVATTGLAAGINFSLRSVFVAETAYHDGPYLRQIQPDELLQMFGRAGRRGKDTCGYILHGDKTPRLIDARARDIRRANEVDWPTLLRVMHLAAEEGRPPFLAASQLCQGLFSKQPILLGIEQHAPREASRPKSATFGLGPTRREILNGQGEWEAYDRRGENEPTTLGNAWTRAGERWIPACRSFALLVERCRLGRVAPLSGEANQRLGKEIVLANRDAAGHWRPVESLAKMLDIPRDVDWSAEDIGQHATERLRRDLGGGKVWRIGERAGQLLMEVDFAESPVAAYRDSSGQMIIHPPERVVSLARSTDIVTEEAALEPTEQSPVRAWRELGLIEANGQPTRRGLVFSFFYHGEGLAVAAALEQADYDMQEIVWHLANIRGGFRFEGEEGGASERLASVCRQTYGPVNHEGYLSLGLPLQYGPGTAETIRHLLNREGFKLGSEILGRGDIERAYNEWLSLLRHIEKCPEVDWDRWMSLKEEAKRRLDGLERKALSPARARGILEPHQRLPYTKHALRCDDTRKR